MHRAWVMQTPLKNPNKNRFHAALGFALLSGLFFVFALVLSGCSKDPGSTRAPIGVGAACDATHLCNPGLECEHGICQVEEEELPCTVNADCPVGQVCEEGECENEEAEEVACTVNADCPVGQVCENGECEHQEEIACTVTADCPPPLVCDNGECENPEAEEHRDAGVACTVDADCPVGQVCHEGECEVHH